MLEKIILFFVLLIPCLPKIMVSKGITMFPAEFLLIIAFPFIAKRTIQTEIQKNMLKVWVLILFSTLLSFIYIPNVGGLLRCYKEIIYVPILWLAFKNAKLRFTHLLYFFIIASVINFGILASLGFSLVNYDIWDTDVLSSGMSNRYIALPSFELGRLPGGSHGIWLQYNVLCCCFLLFAIRYEKASKWLVSVVLIFFMANLAISASREGLISSFLLGIGYLMSYSVKNNRLSFKMSTIVVLAVLVSVIVGVVLYFGNSLGMVQKISYTIESVQDNGQESNIILRINAWKVYFLSLVEFPYMLLIGYGFNTEYYASFLTMVAKEFKGNFVAIPESFFVETLMYGGIVCFIFGVKFWKSVYRFFVSFGNKKTKYILLGVFAGLLFGNTFSGATIISDVVYSQFLIFIGILMKNKAEYERP